MVKKEINILSWIFYVITVILLIYMIVMLILKLTGHSPTEIEIVLWGMGIMTTFLTLILMFLFQIKTEIGTIKGKIGSFEEFKVQTVEKIKELEKKVK